MALDKRTQERESDFISSITSPNGSRDSSVGIATGYGLDDQGEREF
jgi:hypothetical protein